MELAQAIRVVFDVARRRPAQLLPFYLMALAVPSIVRVFTFVGLFVLVGYLVGAGRVAAFQEELARIDTDPPDPETDPVAFFEWVEGLEPLVETIATPTAGIILLSTILVTIIAIFLLTAAVSAGQIGTCFGLLQRENGIVRGIGGIKRHWLSFVGIYLLELILWAIVTLILGGLILGSLLVSLTLGLFVGIFAGFLWLGLVIAIRAIFVFAPVSIVVDRTGVFGSLRGSAGFIRQEFGNAVVYYVIAIGVLLAWGGVSSTAATLGAPSIAAFGSILLVTPFLDLLKTVLFGEYREVIDPPAAPSASLLTQTKRGIRRGLEEMAAFVRATPGFHVVAIAVILGGFGMGWVAIEPFTQYLEASIRARTARIIPPSAALDFFGNNWTVAMTLAYSGLAFAIPAIVGLWFNGFVLGIYAHLEAEPLVLLAFVIPHGIFEIPAILISGALGLFLGVTVWRGLRGTVDREEIADSLERAVWILVGIGVLLAIAGFIEGFISPFYFRPFL